MASNQTSRVDRIFIVLLAILILAALSYAIYVGLTPPESGELFEPYNIQHLTPVVTVTGGP
jgi:uncharacterized membrane protein